MAGRHRPPTSVGFMHAGGHGGGGKHGGGGGCTAAENSYLDSYLDSIGYLEIATRYLDS